jgi:hypothetical protein
MIIGKKTSKTDKPFNFVMPFDSLFDMTSNIIGTKQNDGELVANALNIYNKDKNKDVKSIKFNYLHMSL